MDSEQSRLHFQDAGRKAFFSSLAESYRSGSFCDLVFHFPGQTEVISCHRLILSVVSPNLRNYLLSRPEEQTADIILENGTNVGLQDVKCFINSIYDSLGTMSDIQQTVSTNIHSWFGLECKEMASGIIANNGDVTDVTAGNGDNIADDDRNYADVIQQHHTKEMTTDSDGTPTDTGDITVYDDINFPAADIQQDNEDSTPADNNGITADHVDFENDVADDDSNYAEDIQQYNDNLLDEEEKSPDVKPVLIPAKKDKLCCSVIIKLERLVLPDVTPATRKRKKKVTDDDADSILARGGSDSILARGRRKRVKHDTDSFDSGPNTSKTQMDSDDSSSPSHGNGINKSSNGPNTRKKDGANDTNDSLHSDCLLYTSPSPRDLSTSRMPSSA